MKEAERMSLRRSVDDWIAQAARLGMENAGDIAHRTLREIEAEMQAFIAQRRRAAEEMDRLAWLTGRYVLMAIHSPRRYPARPNGVICRPREMAPEEMKRAFRVMAERGDTNGCG